MPPSTQDSTPKYIYKIAPATPVPQTPSDASSDPVLPVSALDESSGYIHMSTAVQIPGTLGLFFGTNEGENNEVYLLKVQEDLFDGNENGELKWESPDGNVSGDREGEGLFPHLYLQDQSESGKRRLWLRRGEVVDIRRAISGVGVIGWEGAIEGLVGDSWLV